MKASVIIAHPHLNSFNHAIFNTVCSTLESNNVFIYKHDLYKDNFNPVLSTEELGKKRSTDVLVNKLANELIDSNILVFIHPNWWGQPPAILKGYIDRVIRPPYSYDFPPEDGGAGLPIGKLKGKYGIVFNTSNTDETRERDYFNDPLELLWGKCVFGFCGIENYYRKMFSIVAASTLEQRQKWLKEIEEMIMKAIQ
jgi:putative NADPH-quinone reductase